jgi:hypothetical protein
MFSRSSTFPPVCPLLELYNTINQRTLPLLLHLRNQIDFVINESPFKKFRDFDTFEINFESQPTTPNRHFTYKMEYEP